MNNTTLSGRRAFLKGLPVAVAAAALPTLAIADTGTMAALIDAHKAALAAQDAAGKRCDEAFQLYDETLNAEPVTVDLPGLRWLPTGMSKPVNAREISPGRITELYEHYGFYSQRGGAVYVDGAFKLIDLSADRARDEAAAQANLEAAFGTIKKVADDCGLTSAEAAACACDEAADAALFAVLGHSPATVAEGEAKAVYLLGLMAKDSECFEQSDMIRTLIASFAGPATPQLLAEATETERLEAEHRARTEEFRRIVATLPEGDVSTLADQMRWVVAHKDEPQWKGNGRGLFDRAGELFPFAPTEGA